MVKLIALDMDGTLMSPDHVTVSEENRKALKEAHDKGIKISIATGRTLSIIGNVCEQVPETDYIIFSNGAGVYDRRENKVIYVNPMKWEFCEPIIRYLDSNPLMTEIYCDGKSYMRSDSVKYLDPKLYPEEFLDMIIKGTNFCGDVCDELKGKDIEKFTIHFGDAATLMKVKNYLENLEGIALTASFEASLEFTAASADKGNALEGMCRILGIDASECAAFGDADNDLPMIEFSGYGFAMGNATENVKKAAKYVTKTNGEDGVAAGIRNII